LLFYHMSVTVRFPAADSCSGTAILLSPTSHRNLFISSSSTCPPFSGDARQEKFLTLKEGLVEYARDMFQKIGLEVPIQSTRLLQPHCTVGSSLLWCVFLRIQYFYIKRNIYRTIGSGESRIHRVRASGRHEPPVTQSMVRNQPRAFSANLTEGVAPATRQNQVLAS